MEKVLVFIDAGFLSKLNKHFGGGAPMRYNLLKLANTLASKEGMIFHKLFYYTAPPFQSTNPSKDERERRERYDSFKAKFMGNDEMVFREGRCQKINQGGKIVYKQKGVDTLLTMDLMTIPMKHHKTKNVILIASDSDFVPVISELRGMGIDIHLYTYFDRQRNSIFSTSNELLKSVTRYVQLEARDFHASKD